MGFCTKCGAPRTAGAGFCTVCGVPLPSGNAPPPPVAVMPMPPVAAPQGGSGLRTFLIVALVLLLVMIGLGAVAAFYAVRAAKEKAESLLHSVAPLVSSSPVKHAPLPTPSASSFSPWASSPEAKTVAPLKEGMLVVTAIADFQGDYESMKQIQSVDASGTTLSYHSDKPKSGSGTQSSSASEVSIIRKVLAQDLNSAHDYAEIFGSSDPESFPGTTAISASREVFAQLEQKGSTPFTFRPDGVKGAIGSLVSTFSSIAGINSKDMGGVSLEKLSKEECTLEREGKGLFAFPVLLNAQPVTLPALRAGCMTDDGPAEFYILDQPDYPLMLSWKLGSGSQLQVIKITYPPPTKAAKSEAASASGTGIEEQLKEKKKVDIYGIYFDFASDRLKPESTPVLDEIAGVLKDDPDWKLTVNGHTDNIGGDAYNLDLSKRRAAAVKQALATRYHVAPERLSTDGFGATRPVDTNDTLAGRARNRRVELTRE